MSEPQIKVFVNVQSQSESNRLETAFKMFAASRGWPDLKSDSWVSTLQSNTTIEELAQQLQSGDILLLHSLSAISPRPSEHEAIVLGLIGRGVRVMVLELGGDVTPHLQALSSAWASGRLIEQENSRLEALMQRRQRRHEREMIEFQDELVARMSEAFGVRGLLTTLEPPQEQEPNPIGVELRRLREEQGLSQQQLATIVGCSKSAIARSEASGSGDYIDAIFAALGVVGPYDKLSDKPMASRSGEQEATPQQGDTETPLELQGTA